MWSDTPHMAHWRDNYPLSSCPTRIETVENERIALARAAELSRRQSMRDRTGGSDSVERGSHSVRELREKYGIDRLAFADLFRELFGSSVKLRSQVYATAYRKLVAEIEKRGYKPCP